MGRCFSIETSEDNKIFLQIKKGRPRAPYLCLRDYLTEKKIKKNFREQLGFFYDDLNYFPVAYIPLQKDTNNQGYEIKPKVLMNPKTNDDQSREGVDDDSKDNNKEGNSGSKKDEDCDKEEFNDNSEYVLKQDEKTKIVEDEQLLEKKEENQGDNTQQNSEEVPEKDQEITEKSVKEDKPECQENSQELEKPENQDCQIQKEETQQVESNQNETEQSNTNENLTKETNPEGDCVQNQENSLQNPEKKEKKIFVIQKHQGNPNEPSDGKDRQGKKKKKHGEMMITEKLKYEDDEILNKEVSDWLKTKKDVIERWLEQKEDDVSQLPGVEHILMKLGSSNEILELIKNDNSIRIKEVIGLCTFQICHSEKLAKDIFKKLENKCLIFPQRLAPNRIKNEEFRNELCFMEGIRPKKTIAVAERFIQSHLGFNQSVGKPKNNLYKDLYKRRE